MFARSPNPDPKSLAQSFEKCSSKKPCRSVARSWKGAAGIESTVMNFTSRMLYLPCVFGIDSTVNVDKGLGLIMRKFEYVSSILSPSVS